MDIHTKFLLAWIAMSNLTGHGIIKKVNAQNWQDEEHVWDEEKQKWVVNNKGHGRVVNNPGAEKGQFEPPTEEWAKYLPRTVRYGYREAKEWEIKEAQRKLWAKTILSQRAALKAEQRRQLMHWRKVTGWHAKRSANAFAAGPVMQYHMKTSGYYRY